MAAIQKSTVNDTSKFVQYLTFDEIQSAQNTFLEIEIPTGVQPANEFILVLEDLMAEVSVGQMLSTGTARITLSLTRQSKTAEVPLTDVDLLAKYEWANVMEAGVGGSASLEQPIEVAWVGKQIAASPSLFLQFSTTNMAGALRVQGRLSYTTQTMKKEQILEILYG